MTTIDPDYYRAHPSKVEAIELCERLNFCLGNALKYCWRVGKKGDAIEDLKKTAWYLRREIEHKEISKVVDDVVNSVLAVEPEGQLLGDVLRHLYRYNPNLDAALARVEREIERLQEGK